MKLLKKIILLAVFTSTTVFGLNSTECELTKISKNSYEKAEISLGESNEDATSAMYGVYVDTSLWEVRWNNHYEVKTTWNDALYGETEINIGEAFYKRKINNQYRTSMIFAIKTKPRNTYRQVTRSSGWAWWYKEWQEDILQYGVLQSINVKSQLNESTAKVIDSYPKYTANPTSYSIGGEFSVGSSGVNVGISASATYSENAIDITNHTDSSSKLIDIKLERNPNADNGQTKKQMAQENWYYFRYDCLTDIKYLKQSVTVELVYQQLDGLPENNAPVWRTSINTWGLNFI